MNDYFGGDNNTGANATAATNGAAATTNGGGQAGMEDEIMVSTLRVLSSDEANHVIAVNGTTSKSQTGLLDVGGGCLGLRMVVINSTSPSGFCTLLLRTVYF